MSYLQEKLLTLLKNSELPDNQTGKLDYHAALSNYIEQLINTDFAGLVQLLYTLDVDEHTIKQALKGNSGVNSAQLIADIVIKRQGEKIKARKRFTGNENIPDEDKW